MSEGASLPQLGDTVAGKYVLERVLGQGGMSVVYGATHRVTGKRFAIKWLLPEDTAASAGDTARRFIREAQVAGLFQHPNVVEVYDLGQVARSFFMVMEWLDGESLAARLDRVGAMSFDEVCAYLIPCMHGVYEAHAAGIVHRDLKPANIFLCRAMHHTPEKPKVLDFGIAKLSKQTFDVSSLVTKSGVLIGTPHYLSPEQLRSEPVDHRTDIYAFGVILYQLLSGQLPFPADNFGQLVLQIATGTPVPLRQLAPALPEGVETVVAKAMAREPGERFQDVRELIVALEEILSPGVPRSASVPSPFGPTVRSQSQPTPRAALASQPPAQASMARRALPFVALSAVLITAAIVLARLWGEQPSAAAPTPPAASVAVPPATTTTSTSAASAPETVDPAPTLPDQPADDPAPQDAPVDTQPATSPALEPSTAAPRATKRPVRSQAPPPAAAPAPREPETAPEPPASERNPLHMRLQ